MRKLRTTLLALATLTVGVAGASPAWAETVCVPINAKGEGRITSQTLTETDTQSRIKGGGIIRGTTTAQLFPTGFDPATGIETFEGTLVLTTKHGTLTLFVFNGVFDTTTGEFSNDSTVVGGTDRFAGATGDLFFHGFVSADGTFTDDEIKGDICVEVP